MSAADNMIEEKKQQARAELDAYRERRRKEREAQASAAQSAEDEIAAAVHARRAEEERREHVRVAQVAFMERHHAMVERERSAWTERTKAGVRAPGWAPPPARRVAKLLRQHLGEHFDALVSEIAAVDWQSLKNEIKRIPIDEAAEAAHQRNEAIKAKLAEQASTLPEPEDEAEAAILARHGFAVQRRGAELNVGAP